MEELSEESKAQEPVIDRLTRALRRAFKAVNKEAERRQREIDEAARIEDKARRRAERIANRPPEKERKLLRLRKAAASVALEVLEQPKQHCAECKIELPLEDEADPIRLCARCISRLRQLSPGLRNDEVTQFVEVAVYRGGAPGSGKRR